MDHQPTMSINTNMPEQTINMQQATQQRLRALWEKTMRNPTNPVRHDKTSVLLISWDPEHDDLGVVKEVDELRQVFEEDYGFKVTKASLKPDNARKQALADVANFVNEEDSEQSLTIIYYAGHGYGGENAKPGDLNLIGRRLPPIGSVAEAKILNQGVVWSKVEAAISQAEGDVLLIFDCCDAGRLGRPYVRGAEPKNHYQFLGACAGEQTTMGPGANSFTSALRWALKELVHNDAPFTTSRLRAKVMECPDFPEEQIPVLSDRECRDVLGDIFICRKDLPPGTTKLVPTKRERSVIENRAYLDLRLVFESELDDQKLEEAAEALKLFRDGELGRKLDLSRVGFHGKYTAMEHAALRFMEVREAVNRKTGPTATPVAGLPPGSSALGPSEVQSLKDGLQRASETQTQQVQAVSFPNASVGQACEPASQAPTLQPGVEEARPSSDADTEVAVEKAPARNDSVVHHLHAIAHSIGRIMSKLVPGRRRNSRTHERRGFARAHDA